MVKLLNTNQRRSVTIVLRRFEDSLRHAENLLINGGSKGILFQKELVLPPEKRKAAQLLIDEAYNSIAMLVVELNLEPEVENLAGLINGEMSESRADLLDSRSDKLRRFGTVNPGLRQVFDPAIEHLARLALTLADLFTTQAEKQG
jgi:hypothetical protein